MGSKSVLFIDGNAQDRWYYAHRIALTSPDYVIFEAASGQGGLDLCNSHSIDCVILEIDLPDMSGFEVLAKLVPIAEHPKVPIIILTRLSNPDLLDLAKKNGAQAALRTLDISDGILDRTILKAIETVRDRHQGQNSSS
jgi:PleD family two-component response regulator